MGSPEAVSVSDKIFPIAAFLRNLFRDIHSKTIMIFFIEAASDSAKRPRQPRTTRSRMFLPKDQRGSCISAKNDDDVGDDNDDNEDDDEYNDVEDNNIN